MSLEQQISELNATISELNATIKLLLQRDVISALLNMRRSQDELLEKLANAENEINRLMGNPFTK